jgi:hypothetical protein
VSHNTGAILELCKSSILLSNGTFIGKGECKIITDLYAKNCNLTIEPVFFTGPLSRNFKLLSLKINEKCIFSNKIAINFFDEIRIEIDINVLESLDNPLRVSLVVFYQDVRLFTLGNSDSYEKKLLENKVIFFLKKRFLMPGFYKLGLGIRTPKNEWAYISDLTTFEVLDNRMTEFEKNDEGLINLKNEYTKNNPLRMGGIE